MTGMRHDRGVTSPWATIGPIDIRPAHPDHIELIGHLTVGAYHAGGHLTPGSPYESVLRDVGSRLDRTLIADRAGELVGAISAFEHGHPMSELATEGEWEIRFLAVRADCWGSGVARSLMAAAEDRAESGGAGSIVLYVIDRNERARAFYPRLGYVRRPERDWSPLGADATPVHLLAFAKARAPQP